jgi:hypothetical protein
MSGLNKTLGIWANPQDRLTSKGSGQSKEVYCFHARQSLHARLSDLSKLMEESKEVKMPNTGELVNDAEMLVDYALRNKIVLPDGLLDVLRGARSKLGALQQEGPDRDSFYQAFQRIAELVRVSVVDIRSANQRRARLEPLVAAAQKLVAYAAANARQIEDDVRNNLIEAANAVAQGAPTVADEEKFFKAYQALTSKLAPINSATLAASETRIPRWSDLFANPRQFLRDAAGITLGRFVHFAIFVLVLLGTGFALAYQSIGETAMTRYRELDTKIADLKKEFAKKEEAVRDKYDVLTVAQQKDPKSDATRSAQRSWEEAVLDVQAANDLMTRLTQEQSALPARLRKWEEQPCAVWWAKWLCSFSYRSPVGSEPSSPPETLAIVFSAQTALARMSQIVLPLLLGLLGAYSFVLRSMSRDIRELSFAPHSSLQHLVRLSLGSLAGIASGWLLKPEQVGLLNSVPAWTLAFIAGYGTELLFAFMDRLIAAFTTKPT